MDAKQAIQHLRGKFSGGTVEHGIANLIESLASRCEDAERRALTDVEIDILLGVANDPETSPAALKLIHTIVARLRPPKIEWTRVGTTSVMEFGGVTYTVLMSGRNCWWATHDASGNYLSCEDAEAAAEKYAKGAK